MIDGLSQIPNHRLGEVHIYVAFLIMTTCYVSYYLACVTDPGALHSDSDRNDINAAIKRFKYDGVMFEQEFKCKTCKFDKPARSKHCSTCNMCV